MGSAVKGLGFGGLRVPKNRTLVTFSESQSMKLKLRAMLKVLYAVSLQRLQENALSSHEEFTSCRAFNDRVLITKIFIKTLTLIPTG